MGIFVSSYLGRINPGSGYVQNHGDCQSPKEGTASKLAYSFGGDHNNLVSGVMHEFVSHHLFGTNIKQSSSHVVQISAHITNQTIKNNQNNYETKNYLQGIFFISLHTPPEKTHIPSTKLTAKAPRN